jgi:Uma2 family endonuclease
MSLSDKIFTPERYTYKDYQLWEGEWELINGYPIAMSPSANRKHQGFATVFSSIITQHLLKKGNNCECRSYFELDWIISDDTVVRPDVMLVCGKFESDFLTFPPSLILEITSPSSRMRDRNTKFKLYELMGVKYYIISDPDKQTSEIFEHRSNAYQQKADFVFQLTENCIIEMDPQQCW